MAEGYAYLQQPPGSLLYPQDTPTTSAGFPFHHLTSPSQAPDSFDPTNPPNSRMFSQNPQQGHNARINGGPSRGIQQLMYNFPQHGLPGQGHGQLPPSMQQDPSGHNGNGIGHHSGFSSGVMANASPFTPGSMQNGHSGQAPGGQGQPINEHWAEILRLQKECEKAHHQMTNPQQPQPHYYARIKATENRGIGAPPPVSDNTTTGDDDGGGIRRRPTAERNTQAWNNLDLSGQGLRVLSLALFDYQFLQELFLASNNLTYLPEQIGQLRQLRHLDISYNKITDLPPELGMCTYLVKLLAFDNQIRVLPYELGSLEKLEYLGIENNPLNPEMKQEIMEKGTRSLITLLREQAPVPLPPAPPREIVIQEDVSPNLERVKVFSWNVLCEKFATNQQYGYTPSAALAWDYRKQNILQEIRDRNADVLTLQEIAMGAFKDFFEPELKEDGYKGVFYPKQRARTMSVAEQLTVDGCATFYKADKFSLLDKTLVEFRSLAINRPDMKGQDDIFNRVMPKDNICTICFLESRKTGARLIVVNGHLAWEPNLADVKLIQTAIMMEVVQKLTEKYVTSDEFKAKKVTGPPTPSDSDEEARPRVTPQEYKHSTDIPLLVCGDFNSPPDSSVYELLATGNVKADHPDFEGRSYGSFTQDGVHHPFPLKSAYQHLVGTPDELPFTNYTPGFDGVIDYIWFSNNTLEVVELLGPPDKEHLKRVPGFPNYHFPTDHIQLVAEFVIKARKDKKNLPEPDFGGK